MPFHVSDKMKELNTAEFEHFQQFLKYFDENSLGNLSPFFDAKLFTLESPATPASIIRYAYPETEIEKAQISERSRDEVAASIRGFFSHIEDVDKSASSGMATEFLNGLQSCIADEYSNVWEYSPDLGGVDELYDFIAFGFTYIVVTADENRCLVIHGGYMD